MKRIILDHLKRWWLLWLVIGIANCFMMGSLLDEKHNFGALTFQLVLWLGAMQLNFDLQRGVGRTVITLPVTARQIGRAWWSFSVALPALLLAVTSGIALLLHSAVASGAFPINGFVVIATANTLFLGALFFLFAGSLPGWPQNIFGWLRHILSIVILMGIIFIQPALDTPKGIALLLVAAVLTVVGWFRSEQMVLLRAGFRPGIQLGKRQPGQHKAPAGFGGLPYLWQNLFGRLFYMGIAFVIFMLFMQMFTQGSFNLSPQRSFEATLPALSSFGYFFVSMALVLPMIMQLRSLRVLPISTNSLAATLVLTPATPFLLIGMVLAALGRVYSGNLIQISLGFLACSAMMSAAVPFFVWQGLKTGTYFLTLFLLLAIAGVPLSHAHIPMAVALPVCAGIIALAFEMTRRLLNSSSRAYRPLPTLMTGFGGFGGGR